MDLVPQYFSSNIEQFGGCLIKIKEILSILQGLWQSFEFQVLLNCAFSSVDVGVQ